MSLCKQLTRFCPGYRRAVSRQVSSRLRSRRLLLRRRDGKSAKLLFSFWLSQKVACGPSPPTPFGPDSREWCGPAIPGPSSAPPRSAPTEQRWGRLVLSNVRPSSHSSLSRTGWSLLQNQCASFNRLRVVTSPVSRDFSGPPWKAELVFHVLDNFRFGVFFLSPSFGLDVDFPLPFSDTL